MMIESYGIKLGIEYYSCMIDFLGCVGLFEEVENMLERVECRDDVFLWGVLFGFCVVDVDVLVIVEWIVKRMMGLDLKYYMSYVFLSNMYKLIGCYGDVFKICRLMVRRGVIKIIGQSWIDVYQKIIKVYIFLEILFYDL